MIFPQNRHIYNKQLYNYGLQLQQTINPNSIGERTTSHFEELKRTMQDQINEGHQIKITNQIEGFPLEDEVLLRSIQEVDTWFEGYGF